MKIIIRKLISLVQLATFVTVVGCMQTPQDEVTIVSLDDSVNIKFGLIPERGALVGKFNSGASSINVDTLITHYSPATFVDLDYHVVEIFIGDVCGTLFERSTNIYDNKQTSYSSLGQPIDGKTYSFTVTSYLSSGGFTESTCSVSATIDYSILLAPSTITLGLPSVSSIAATGESSLTFTAIVTDMRSHLLPNQMVTLNIPNGGGSSQTQMTNESGEVTLTLTSSTNAGSYSYTASVAGSITSSPQNVEFTSTAVPSLSYSGDLNLNESLANDGSISETVVITIANDTFSGAMGTFAGASVSTLPPGSFAGSFNKISETQVEFTITGAATNHTINNNTGGIRVTFSDTAFTNNATASNVSNYISAAYTVKYLSPSSLTYGLTALNESVLNNGSVEDEVTVTLNNDIFKSPLVAGTDYVVSAPSGLSVNISRDTDTLLTISLSSSALTHESINNTPLSITFSDSAFVYNASASSVGSSSMSIPIIFQDALAITNITAQGAGSYGIGSYLYFAIEYAAAVNVVGEPRLELALVTGTVYANYYTGSGTSTLGFKYLIAADHNSNGISVTSPIFLNGGSIKDGNGNDVNLLFSSPNTSGIIVDGTLPTITIDSKFVDSYININNDSSSFSITGDCTDSSDTLKLKIDGSYNGVSMPCNTGRFDLSFDSTAYLDGDHLFRVYIQDLAGNLSYSDEIVIIFDRVAPTRVNFFTGTGETVLDGFLYQNTMSIIFNATDLNSFTYHYEEGTTPYCGSAAVVSANIPVVGHGLHVNIRAIACDAAGNSSVETFVTLHNIIPSITPFYSTAPNWGDWVDTAGAACQGSGECFHGGEFRAVELTGVDLCDGLSLTTKITTTALDILDWTCNDSTGTAIFRSRFRIGKSVKDLLTSDAWLESDIKVEGTRVIGVVESSGISYSFDNPVQALPASSSTPVDLQEAHGIYTVDSSMDSAGIKILADGISIIGISGAGAISPRISKSGGMTSNCSISVEGVVNNNGLCLVQATGRKYLYLDIDLDGSDGTNKLNDIVNLTNTNYAIIDSSHYSHAQTSGLHLLNSNYIHVNNLSVADISGINVGYGVRVESSTKNKFNNIKVNDCDDVGFGLNNSRYNKLSNIKAASNAYVGLYLTSSSSSNSIYKVEVSNHENELGYAGLTLDGYSNDNVISGVLATHNTDGINFFNASNNILMDVSSNANSDTGVYLDGDSRSNRLMNVTVTENTANGMLLQGASSNTIENFVASHNGSNIVANGTQLNTFSGAFILGNALTACLTNVDAGLDCSNESMGIDISGEYVGNTSLQATDPFNWLDSVMDYRSWGLNSTSGACTDFTNCYRWDWRLRSGVAGSYLWETRNVPTVSDFITHTWSSGADPTTFLLNAREITEYDHFSGNKNLLCEIGENCVISRNISAYQGEGVLSKDIVIDTSPEIQLWEYANNGF